MTSTLGNDQPDQAIVLSSGASELMGSFSQADVAQIGQAPGVAHTADGRPIVQPRAAIIVELENKTGGGTNNIAFSGSGDMGLVMSPPTWRIVEGRRYTRGLHELLVGRRAQASYKVFGNLGTDSGTGVAFTRDPGTGPQGVYGDYLQNAQGEDVVAGIRNTVPLQDLEGIDKAAYDQLMQIMRTLENHYRDLCDIEFTIERGKLWMLQTRVGKRTAAAAFRIAMQLVDQGLIDKDEALNRVTGEELARLMFPRFDTGSRRQARSPRASARRPARPSARPCSTRRPRVERAAKGEKVILVRRETNPDDLQGMIAAQGILTSRGGKTSHAAVVARGMGKTCVCGADELDVDTAARSSAWPTAPSVNEGDVISIDGSPAPSTCGEVAVVPSAGGAVLRGRAGPGDEADELVAAVHAIMTHADDKRSLGVHANADTGEDCARARRLAPAASAWSGPSTCSWASAASWSRS